MTAGQSMKRSMLEDLAPAVRGLILDMDGVLWREPEPIGDLAAIFSRIASQGLNFVAATNNATKTGVQYLERLRGFGVTLEPWQILTSSDAAADMLTRALPGGSAVFVVGEYGVTEALRGQGFAVITNPEDVRQVAAVVGGIDRALTYRKLLRAAAHVRAGAPFYGTNADATFPTSAGLAPGAGSILAAIATAAESQPVVIGKPSRFMFEVAADRMKLTSTEILVVGDRLETDIAGGRTFGARTALVLSGVSTRAQATAWRPKPDLIAENLGQLVGA
jgi:4-nitrophenyl phosphatase